MTTQFPAANAPTPQQRWVRAAERAITDLERQAQIATNRGGNSASSSAGQLGQLQIQVRDLRDQAGRLQDAVDYQASLLTGSDSGASFQTGDIPGDQVTRWQPSGTKTTIRAATGRVLLALGVSQVTVQAGNSSLNALLRVHYFTASGSVDTTVGNGIRVFVTNGTFFGVPMYGERTIDGLPTDEDITFELEFGYWSAATSPLGNAQFTQGFVRAQVVPA